MPLADFTSCLLPGFMKIILVNPWIADFAAYNFWVRPLGLYRLAEWLWERGAEPVLLDCLAGFKAPAKFKRRPAPLPHWVNIPEMDRSFARYGISFDEFDSRLGSLLPAEAVLVTSVMSYWYPGVIWAVERIRRAAPDMPIALGGIYATLWPEHARQRSGADIVFEGGLDRCGARLARWLGLPEEPVRPRRPWYMLGLHDGAPFSGIRTAEGCPFRCSYCASRLVSGPFRPRGPQQILDEITSLYQSGVRSFCFYDDALLVDFRGRTGPVLKKLCSMGIEAEFHTPNGLHARLIDEYAAFLMAASGFKTIRLSLETVDIDRQLKTGGKVSTEDVSRAVGLLLDAGIDRKAVGVYLMAGLPGQDLSEVEEGIRFVKGLGVRPYIAEFSPIPGTAEWERLKDAGLLSDGIDPIFTNNTIFYWHAAGLERSRLHRLKEMARA